LSIPTVVDRVVQQAIAQLLIPLYEPQLSDHSYGFRPKRNAHRAITKCTEYITAGYGYAVDLNLEKFFDKVNHSKLIEVLSGTVTDGRVVSLIHKYLNWEVQVGESYQASYWCTSRRAVKPAFE
jgi:retron-type reverse transcriptase